LIDELDQLQRLAAFDFRRLDFLIVEQNVIAFGNLETLDDIVPINRPDSLHHLFVIDRFAGRLVDLAKTDRRA